MKTAVEWLGEKILELGNSYELPEDDIDELIIKAKEMEKKYINDAHCHGYDYCRLRELDEQDNDLEFDYFQITFKQQEQ